MLIYKKEVDDGVSEKVKANTSVAYKAPIKSLSTTPDFNLKLEDVPELAKSSLKDNWDLYPFSSVLVSVGWNGNDDVFEPGEAWAAKNSPVDKQLNFMHDETAIIGHMTASLVMDAEGKILEEEPDSVPEFYHIVVANVLYRKWSDEKLQERVDKIIAGIPEDRWFVSMECLFKNFDYAIISPDNEHSILPRNESTAFLTKHLRAYGGTGTYEDHKIGRLIRNLTFSGNAVVDNPANPHSIIFNETNPFKSTAKTIAVSFPKQEKVNMADTQDVVMTQLKDELAKANAKSEKLEEKLEQQVEAARQKEQERFEKEIANLKVDVEDLEAKVKERDETLAKKEEELENLNKEHKQVVAERDEKDEKLAKAQKEQVKATRLSKLVDVKVDRERAEALVDKFDNLTDEQFDEIVAVQDEMMKDKEKDKDDKDKSKNRKDKKSMASSDDDDDDNSDALDNANADDNGFVPGGDDKEEAEAELATAALSWFDDIRKNKDK